MWNSYKAGVIRKDTLWIVEDVKISDKSKGDGSTFAVTYAFGKIVFYQDTMDAMTSTQRQATIMHEIGHALNSLYLLYRILEQYFIYRGMVLR